MAALDRAVDITIEDLWSWEFRILVPGPPNTEEEQQVQLRNRLLMSDGSISNHVTNNLITKLSEDDPTGVLHVTNLLSLRDYIQNRIDLEVLPTP